MYVFVVMVNISAEASLAAFNRGGEEIGDITADWTGSPGEPKVWAKPEWVAEWVGWLEANGIETVVRHPPEPISHFDEPPTVKRPLLDWMVIDACDCY